MQAWVDNDGEGGQEQGREEEPAFHERILNHEAHLCRSKL